MWYMWKSYCGSLNAKIDLLWNSLFFISGIIFYLVKTSWRLRFKRYVCLGKTPFQVEKEVYSEPYQTSKMECFAKIINGLYHWFFSQNAPFYMFDSVLNTPMVLLPYFPVFCNNLSFIESTDLHFDQKRI